MSEVAKSPIVATGQDLEILARTIFGEARGESLEGQIVVAYTIVHRAQIAAAYIREHHKAHPLYGDGTIGSACKVKWQYSCWNPDDPTHLKMLNATLDDTAFHHAHDVAFHVICGDVEDRLPGTTHYFNPDAVAKVPNWSIDLPYHSIGHHRFFRNVP